MNSILEAKIIDSNVQFYGLTKLQLMESAGKSLAQQFEKDFGFNKQIHIFSGLGNNGGDGFVMARYLKESNNVTVTILGLPNKIESTEAYKNFLILQNSNIKINFVTDSSQLTKIKENFIIDALIGSGFKGKLREPFKSTVFFMNQSKAKKIAVDNETFGFKADKVYCLLNKKNPKGIVLDIGIPKEFFSFTGPGNVKFLNKRNNNSHKGENGQVLIIGGSKKYHGAIIFASKAASLFADLVNVLTVKENVSIVKKASASLIVTELNLKNVLKQAKKANSVLIGPGLEENALSKKIINFLLKNFSEKKFVLDAGSLALVDKKLLNKNIVLTPHKKEFKKVFKLNANETNVKKMSKKFNCLIILKGPVDFIGFQNNLFKNFSGNKGMTTGGTGDILAGTIVGIASTNPLFESVLAGTFLTGFTGDLIKEQQSIFNAENVLYALPSAKKVCEKNY